jgi:hypothetical protein
MKLMVSTNPLPLMQDIPGNGEIIIQEYYGEYFPQQTSMGSNLVSTNLAKVQWIAIIFGRNRSKDDNVREINIVRVDCREISRQRNNDYLTGKPTRGRN